MRQPCDAAYNKSAPRAQSGVEKNKEDLEGQMENILQRKNGPGHTRSYQPREGLGYLSF